MPFTIHHVGARFGSTPFSIPEVLARDIALVLFDADEDCVDGLVQRAHAAGVQEQIFGACLSDRDGVAEFKLTVNPSASSLLEPSPRSQGFVQPLFGIDWDVFGCATVVERRSLTTTRLDTLLSARPEIPTPDFLSIDTQGSEFDILSGAVKTIASDVVGVVVEVEFVDLYHNVKRFGEVSRLLESLGFHFCGFLDMIDAQASRQPIGMRSKGFPVAADALFLRRLDSASALPAHKLPHLAFTALLFGFLDYAFAALQLLAPGALDTVTEPWADLVRRLDRAGREMSHVYLPRFPDILRTGDIKRFSREPDPAQWPSMMDSSVWLREHRALGRPLDDVLAELESTADSPVERVLREAGLNALAEQANFARRDQAYKARRFLESTATAA